MTGSSPLAATQLDTDGALWLGRCRFSSVVSKNDFSLCSPKENRHTVHKKAMKPFESDPACQEDDKGMRDPFDGRSGVDRVAQRRRRDKKKQFLEIPVFMQASSFYQRSSRGQTGSESILAVTNNNSSPLWVPKQAQNPKERELMIYLLKYFFFYANGFTLGMHHKEGFQTTAAR